jgi:hypothetical protein
LNIHLLFIRVVRDSCIRLNNKWFLVDVIPFLLKVNIPSPTIR